MARRQIPIEQPTRQAGRTHQRRMIDAPLQRRGTAEVSSRTDAEKTLSTGDMPVDKGAQKRFLHVQVDESVLLAARIAALKSGMSMQRYVSEILVRGEVISSSPE